MYCSASEPRNGTLTPIRGKVQTSLQAQRYFKSLKQQQFFRRVWRGSYIPTRRPPETPQKGLCCPPSSGHFPSQCQHSQTCHQDKLAHSLAPPAPPLCTWCACSQLPTEGTQFPAPGLSWIPTGTHSCSPQHPCPAESPSHPSASFHLIFSWKTPALAIFCCAEITLFLP